LSRILTQITITQRGRGRKKIKKHWFRGNIKTAIKITAKMTSCSADCLQKAYCRSCTYSIETFTCAFAGKFYEQMVVVIQNRS